MKNPFLKKKVKKESVVEKYLRDQVLLHNGEIRKVKWLDRKGAPDRLIMFDNGVSAWVELKSETGDLSGPQEREHTRLLDRGQCCVVIRYEREVDSLIDELYAESLRRGATI